MKRSELASVFVDVDNMPWEKTRYEGIEQKTLLVDPKSGGTNTMKIVKVGEHLKP